MHAPVRLVPVPVLAAVAAGGLATQLAAPTSVGSGRIWHTTRTPMAPMSLWSARCVRAAAAAVVRVRVQ